MIEEQLKKGRGNAVSIEYLMNVTGLQTDRAVQRQIARERKAGALILSNTAAPGGYFLPADAAEVRQFVRTLEKRGAGIFSAIQSARRYLRDLEGQEYLADWWDDEDGKSKESTL